MARTAVSKTDMLDESGYSYTFDRQLYINRKTKKAFSVEYVQDHSEDQLLKRIEEDPSGPEWQFYFNLEPSEAVKRELECALG